MIMEYEEIEAMMNYCRTRVKNLTDADKVEVLKTVCCKLLAEIARIEFKLDTEDEPD